MIGARAAYRPVSNIFPMRLHGGAVRRLSVTSRPGADY
jgi:hypothetical protein